jgi:multicomponent Na+:H+ antiporter subunit B
VSPRVRLLVFVPAAVGLGALLLWSYAGLPDFGHYRGPYGFVLAKASVPERHVTNVVNATTYDYRGFDTLGEEFILFGAVVGVVLLLRGERRDTRLDDTIGNDLVRVGGAVAVCVALLVGLWLVAFGMVTPGGGFQGGVALAAGALLLYLACSYRAWSGFGNEHVLDPLEGLAAGGFVVVGLAALISGLPFLTNVLGLGTTGTIWSGGSAYAVNWAAGIEVAAAVLVLFTEFLDEYVVPLPRPRG